MTLPDTHGSTFQRTFECCHLRGSWVLGCSTQQLACVHGIRANAISFYSVETLEGEDEYLVLFCALVEKES